VGTSLSRYGGDRRQLRATLPRLPPFALHVNLAQASQVQIAIGRLEALTMGRQCNAFRAPRCDMSDSRFVAVGHQPLTLTKPSMTSGLPVRSAKHRRPSTSAAPQHSPSLDAFNRAAVDARPDQPSAQEARLRGNVEAGQHRGDDFL
jgi:hypothetical protein